MIHAIIGLTLIQVSGWALLANGHHLAGIAILATTAAALMTIGHINGRRKNR